jgi:hypothetical protein
MWLREFCGRWCFRAIMFFALYAAGFPPIHWLMEYQIGNTLVEIFGFTLVLLGPIWFLMFVFGQGYDE